jgi:hypothetical protein
MSSAGELMKCNENARFTELFCAESGAQFDIGVSLNGTFLRSLAALWSSPPCGKNFFIRISIIAEITIDFDVNSR